MFSKTSVEQGLKLVSKTMSSEKVQALTITSYAIEAKLLAISISRA